MVSVGHSIHQLTSHVGFWHANDRFLVGGTTAFVHHGARDPENESNPMGTLMNFLGKTPATASRMKKAEKIQPPPQRIPHKLINRLLLIAPLIDPEAAGDT